MVFCGYRRLSVSQSLSDCTVFFSFLFSPWGTEEIPLIILLFCYSGCFPIASLPDLRLSPRQERQEKSQVLASGFIVFPSVRLFSLSLSSHFRSRFLSPSPPYPPSPSLSFSPPSLFLFSPSVQLDPLIYREPLRNRPSKMAEFVRATIFGTTFEITSRYAPRDRKDDRWR